jgi:hypothetical protein
VHLCPILIIVQKNTPGFASQASRCLQFFLHNTFTKYDDLNLYSY